MNPPSTTSTRGVAGLRRLGLFLLLAATIAGLWALSVRFSEGLIVTNMTQHVPWGFWISLYIFFIGLSAGSFLLSTLVYVFGVRRFEAAGPMALVQALGCLGLGLVLIWIDLGHPERFLNVFLYWNPTSVLAWECLFYTAYAVILVAELYLVMSPRWRGRAAGWLKWLGIIGIPIAIGVHGGTGAIFAVVKSRPTWYTGLFPIVFLVSALASGGALLTFLAAATGRMNRERRLDLVRGLARLTGGIVVLDLLLLASEVLVVLYGGMPNHVAGWREILTGPYAWVFWALQIGLGAVVPILIVAGRRTGRSLGWLGLAGLLVVIGVVGVRLNIVIPAQIEPQFATLPDAYQHIRYERGYFPSANEWLSGVGVIALGLWAFLLAKRVLPLEDAGGGAT